MDSIFYLRGFEAGSMKHAVSSINTIVRLEKEQEEQHRGLGSSFGLPNRDYSTATFLHSNGDKDDKNDEVVYCKFIRISNSQPIAVFER